MYFNSHHWCHNFWNFSQFSSFIFRFLLLLFFSSPRPSYYPGRSKRSLYNIKPCRTHRCPRSPRARRCQCQQTVPWDTGQEGCYFRWIFSQTCQFCLKWTSSVPVGHFFLLVVSKRLAGEGKQMVLSILSCLLVLSSLSEVNWSFLLSFWAAIHTSLQNYNEFNEYAFSPPIMMTIFGADISRVLYPVTIHISFDLCSEGETQQQINRR